MAPRRAIPRTVRGRPDPPRDGQLVPVPRAVQSLAGGQSWRPEAARLFRKSLPFAIKVAHRFGYRWPIFFDLQTLEIIRAESAPGKGGENDVAGLYALVMLEAYEMTGKSAYLDEAKEAASALEGLGFALGYQTNTTGFGAEAMLRLWELTGDDLYMGLADVCIANLLDNVWLWTPVTATVPAVGRSSGCSPSMTRRTWPRMKKPR